MSFALVLLLAAPAPALAGKGGKVAGTVSTTPRKWTKDIVVYLKQVAGKHKPESKVMDQRKLVFIPHVLPVVVGSKVKFLNSDNVGHNVFSPDNEKYNLGTWPQGQTKAYTFSKLGVYTQLCHVHPEMQAFVVVLQNPYYAVTTRDGAFSISEVPPGRYTVVAWSEKLPQREASVTVAAGATATVNFELRR
jgi:plastocyanin